MHRHHYNSILLILIASILILFSNNDACALLEIGAKAGFDSNIDRAVEDGLSDSYITGFISFMRDPGEGTNADWSFNLSLEGTGYSDSNDLNYTMASMTPAVIFYPHQRWKIDVSPFIQATKFNDADQSAVAFGGEISMAQLWGTRYYTGEYFIYTDSSADADIYSYKDKAVGVYVGVNWTDTFWSEIGYELASGDSFRAVEEVSINQEDTNQTGTDQAGNGRGGMGQGGMGSQSRYSEAYNSYILSEPVNRKTLGVNMGYQFTAHFFSFINYAYTTYKGDAGESESHTGILGIGYKF